VISLKKKWFNHSFFIQQIFIEHLQYVFFKFLFSEHTFDKGKRKKLRKEEMKGCTRRKEREETWAWRDEEIVDERYGKNCLYLW
jgi:hypothetical protein